MKEVFKEVETGMKHAVDHFHHELKHLRTGRASLALLEGITADYYGPAMPLNQLATLSVPDTSMTIAQVADSLGFSEAAYFSRSFRRWTGVSPKDFRSQR